LTTSILTLLALYFIYSEPFKLPSIIKENKKLSYILIIGLYLYYLQNNNVEGSTGNPEDDDTFIGVFIILGIVIIGGGVCSRESIRGDTTGD